MANCQMDRKLAETTTTLRAAVSSGRRSRCKKTLALLIWVLIKFFTIRVPHYLLI